MILTEKIFQELMIFLYLEAEDHQSTLFSQFAFPPKFTLRSEQTLSTFLLLFIHNT